MRRGEEMLVSLHDHFPIRVTDWLLSAILFCWGLTLFSIHPTVWDLPIYDGLNDIAAQNTWASVATVIGLARLVALFINGTVRRSPHLRLIGAVLSGLIWLQVSMSLMFSDMSTAAAAIYPWLALADAFNGYRAAKDAGTADTVAYERSKTIAARRVSNRA